MNSKIFFRRMTAVWSVKTQRKRISSHLKNESPTKPRYSINSSTSKMCFVTTIFANILRIIIQNRFHLLLKVLKHSKFSEWCSLCCALCCRRLLLRCSRWILCRRSRSRGFSFGVKSSPAWIYSRLLHSAFLCFPFCSIYMRDRMRFTDSKHCFADDEYKQVSSSYFGHGLEIFSRMFPRNKKMRRDVRLLYDAMADTMGYIQIKMNAASLQLASIHSRSTQCTRFARDRIRNSQRGIIIIIINT